MYPLVLVYIFYIVMNGSQSTMINTNRLSEKEKTIFGVQKWHIFQKMSTNN